MPGPARWQADALYVVLRGAVKLQASPGGLLFPALPPIAASHDQGVGGRGLHSSTSQLNLSRF
jgi:hypothetical protein